MANNPQIQPQTDMSPSGTMAVITASDTTVLAPTRGIYCGGAGNITVVDLSGNTVEMVGLLAGAYYPIRCTKVTAATTATNLVAWF